MSPRIRSTSVAQPSTHESIMQSSASQHTLAINEVVENLPSLTPNQKCPFDSRFYTNAPPAEQVAAGPLPVRSSHWRRDGSTSNLAPHPIQKLHERKREKVKRFMTEKGPKIVGGAAAIGVFVFNILSNCC